MTILRCCFVFKLEKEIMAIAADKSKADALWHQLDFNNNGAVSLAGQCAFM